METIEKVLKVGNVLVYNGRAATVTMTNTAPHSICFRVVGEESTSFLLDPVWGKDLRGLPIDDIVLKKIGLNSKGADKGILYTYEKVGGENSNYHLGVKYSAYIGSWAATVVTRKCCISHARVKYLHELQNILIDADFDMDFINGIFDKVKRRRF